MQEISYPEKIDPRLHIYPSQEADRLKSRLLEHHETGILDAIGRELFTRMDTAGLVPIFVLRGGLALRDAYVEAAGFGPAGVIVPWRARHTEDPTVSYASLPVVPGARYALVDTLIASGRTIIACLQALRVRVPGARVDVVAPFLATAGRERVIADAADTHIHCVWHAEDVDGDGRMVGPGFDVGDLVLGWQGRHLVWSGERGERA